MRLAAPTSASHRVPIPSLSRCARSGWSPASSLVEASPRVARASSAAADAASTQAAGSSATPLSATNFSSFRRSFAATARDAAASTTGTSSRGTTKSVRRIASIRTSVRSS